MNPGKQFFRPHPFTPGLGKWEVFAGPPGLLLLLPLLHPPFFPGAGLFHPVSRQQSGAPGGTSFPEEPAGGGGTGRGGGGPRGGAKTGPAATASELAGRLDPELLNSSQSPGSRARGSVCAQAALGRWGAGTPGCCTVGGPGHAPHPTPDAPVAPLAATAPDSGTRSTDALTSDFGVPQP